MAGVLENPWLLASRPKTLLAGIAPVIAGTGVAIFENGFSFWPALAALLGAIFIQIGANFANDVADFQRGADTSERLGPLRVTQAGLLSPRQVKTGMWVSFGLAALIGLYLIAEAGWPVIVIGIVSIVAGIAYTGGPIPLGYYGLGDIMVFVFFGPTAVIGTYYVQTLSLSELIVWVSLPIGALATAILVVNNLRDINTDQQAGKVTLAVRLGQQGTRYEYLFLILISFFVPLFLVINHLAPVLILICFFTLPLAIRLTLRVFKDQGLSLNPVLGRTSQLEFLFSVLLALGLIL